VNDHIALLTCGPAEHGIARFGRELAGAACDQGFTGPVLHESDPHRLIEVVRRLPTGVRLVHLQANDWLFTDAVHRADEAMRSLAAALRTRGARLSLTLHDLPHQAVSRELFLRRAHTYAAMMAQAVSVVVSSDHERMLIEEAAAALRQIDGAGARPRRPSVVTVIPLPIHRNDAIRERPTPMIGSSTPTVGILGYLYPGKGHRDVLEELSGLSTVVTVVALGRPSDGHEAMLGELLDLGHCLGVEFRCTGFVPDGELTAQLRDVSVAVAPAPQVSASGSINTWIAAGRRPLVRASRYACELDGRMPGAIAIYQPGDLRARVESALASPSTTHLPPGFRPCPDRREVAVRYLRWLRSTAAGSAGAGPAGNAHVVATEFETGGGGHYHG
jgi:hypothetical protein